MLDVVSGSREPPHRASEASSAPSLLQRIASGAKGPASIVNSPQLRNPMFDASHAHLLPSATASASSPSEKGRERSTLKVPGSLFVSTGLGMRKPEEDYFAANFSGSPRRMMQRALEAMEESEEEKRKSGKEMD